MIEHVDELLTDFILGKLAEDERKRVEAHLATCARCASEALATQEAIAIFAWATPPVKPSPEARMRLLQATRPVQPLKPMQLVDQLAQFFDVSVATARSILHKASNPAAWVASPLPGMHLLHVLGGKRLAGADAGLVRLAGGMSFPWHTHLGEEQTLILEGGVTLNDGHVQRVGEILVMDGGSRHAYTVHEEGCTFALTLHGGVDIDGIGKITATPK
jgi:putative transcriptional regulator